MYHFLNNNIDNTILYDICLLYTSQATVRGQGACAAAGVSGGQESECAEAVPYDGGGRTCLCGLLRGCGGMEAVLQLSLIHI